jgi:TRAP-type uncharacterized transport system substrate-binding protein
MSRKMKLHTHGLMKRLRVVMTQGVAVVAIVAIHLAGQPAWAEQRHQAPAAAPAAGVEAQDPVEHQANAPDVRLRINNGTVGVISDGKFGVAPDIVADLSIALNTGDDLRVLPYMGDGSQQNIVDLLYLKGVDVANIQTDVFQHSQSIGAIPNIHSRINYITKLFDKEIHLIARKDIVSIQDLAGKTVSFDLKNSSASITAKILFESLNISVEPVYDHPIVALKKLRLGEIAAVVSVEPKPWDFLRNISNSSDLHFLSIDYTDALSKTYLPASLTAEDYPNLVEPGGRVDTIAVESVMAVFNWQVNSDRYRKVAKFVAALFSRFDHLQNPPSHPKWRKVNLAASVPGWTRFPAAQQLLDEKRKERSGLTPEEAPASDKQDRFTHANTAQVGAVEEKAEPASAKEEQLRQEFLRWWQQQRTR